MKDFQVAHRAADHSDLGICTALIFGWFWFLLRAQPNINYGVERLWGWTVVSTQAVHLMGSMGPVQLQSCPVSQRAVLPSTEGAGGEMSS